MHVRETEKESKKAKKQASKREIILPSTGSLQPVQLRVSMMLGAKNFTQNSHMSDRATST